MKFNIEIEISNDQVETLICSAFEGGSNYWMDFDTNPLIKDFKWNSNNYPAQIVNGDVEVNIYDNANDEELLGRLNTITIQQGLKIMVDKYPAYFADIINENDDAETGDVFMQCCIMGEVVFG